MGTMDKIRRSPFGFMSSGLKCVAALFVALTLAVSVLLVGAAVSYDSAYAAIYPVSDSTQTATLDEAAGETVIADDENPMSSGLDSAMVASNAGVPLYAFAAAGIVAVAAFFLVSTRKLNENISKMNQSVR